ncbi:hypothetical protein [Nostoc sp. 'Peltigera membranacea cyanobiont' 210A]|nr:hypothetical protein [Nostoc sp. 'Peltigera membranacea cyanobiont' 210A]
MNFVGLRSPSQVRQLVVAIATSNTLSPPAPALFQQELFTPTYLCRC